VDVYLAVASRRDHKGAYADRPVPDEIATRVLDAGRLAGSAQNRQPWRFVRVESDEARRTVADLVYSPTYVLTAPLVVVLVAMGGRPAGLDHGRAAQNMLLTAWDEGLASGPTQFSDRDAARAALGLADDEQTALVLAFGYAERARDATSRPAEEWSRRANRRPLAELATRI
jgi:nitroreductase